MQFPFMSQAVTGTAIPVGALRTDESVGCGEFLDLIPFAQFCNKAGMNLIQLLPVNDTGTESSPYSADLLASADAVVIITDHSTFDYQHLVDHSRLIIDTRNATAKTAKSRARIVRI